MSGLPGIAARQKSSRRPIGRGIRGGKSTCGGESSELGDGRPLILPSVPISLKKKVANTKEIWIPRFFRKSCSSCPIGVQFSKVNHFEIHFSYWLWNGTEYK